MKLLYKKIKQSHVCQIFILNIRNLFTIFFYLVWPTWSNVCLQTNQRQELVERLWRVTLERPGSIPRRSNLSLVIGFRRESLLPRFPLGLIRWSYTRPLRLHVLPNMINKRIGFKHITEKTIFCKRKVLQRNDLALTEDRASSVS